MPHTSRLTRDLPLSGHRTRAGLRVHGLQVPLACDLSRVVPQLAVRGQHSGTVSLAVRKAEALDPEEAALQPGPDGDAARQVGQARASVVLLLGPAAACWIADRATTCAARRRRWTPGTLPCRQVQMVVLPGALCEPAVWRSGLATQAVCRAAEAGGVLRAHSGHAQLAARRGGGLVRPHRVHVSLRAPDREAPAAAGRTLSTVLTQAVPRVRLQALPCRRS